MALRYLNNKYGGTVLVHADATSTIVVAGASGVSNIVANSVETIVSANIQKIWWGISNGAHATVARGANVIMTLVQSGEMDFSGNGEALAQDNTANLVVTVAGSPTAANILVQLKKKSS